MTYPSALVLHPDCALHDPGWGHPEHQGRLPAIVHAIYKDTPDLQEVLLQWEATPATEDDLLLVHTPDHLRRVRDAVDEAARHDTRVFLEVDTPVSGPSWAAAIAAAGSAMSAAGLVLDGRAATAFAPARPPGHHAFADKAMGFCVFNNVAVAARWAQRKRGVGRVLIIDWDVHHGNGTQDIFYEDPDVYFLSIHQSPWYPGTGDAAETGAGRGAGTTLNLPVPAGLPPAEFHRIFDDGVRRAFREFQPELVFISAGFDCMAGDPLGGLLLEPADIHRLATTVHALVRETAGFGPVAVVEGGYNPRRTGLGAVNVIRGFCGLGVKG